MNIREIGYWAGGLARALKEAGLHSAALQLSPNDFMQFKLHALRDHELVDNRETKEQTIATLPIKVVYGD